MSQRLVTTCDFCKKEIQRMAVTANLSPQCNPSSTLPQNHFCKRVCLFKWLENDKENPLGGYEQWTKP